MLHARLEINRNNFAKAIPELNAVIASGGTTDFAEVGTQRLQAYALRASVMSRMGRLDLAAANWKAAGDESPDFVEAHWRVGAAYLELGRPNEAITGVGRISKINERFSGSLDHACGSTSSAANRLPTECRNGANS